MKIQKYEDGKKARRVNFTKWYELEKKKKGTKVRPFNGDILTQFEDSLIANNFDEAQRLALLATAHLEMGKAGAASRGIGGNGIIGLSSGRMPLRYLKNPGDQIHYIILDVLNRTQDNWTAGGTGGPYIKNAKEGYLKFYDATTPYDATVLLNKAYIRPAAKSDWDVRGLVAKDMSTFLYKKGSKIHIKKANRGKFTSYCGGTVTDACIQRGKNSPDPAIRKRATFAANARKWKHANGGLLGYYQEDGTEFCKKNL